MEHTKQKNVRVLTAIGILTILLLIHVWFFLPQPLVRPADTIYEISVSLNDEDVTDQFEQLYLIAMLENTPSHYGLQTYGSHYADDIEWEIYIISKQGFQIIYVGKDPFNLLYNAKYHDSWLVRRIYDPEKLSETLYRMMRAD